MIDDSAVIDIINRAVKHYVKKHGTPYGLTKHDLSSFAFMGYNRSLAYLDDSNPGWKFYLAKGAYWGICLGIKNQEKDQIKYNLTENMDYFAQAKC